MLFTCLLRCLHVHRVLCFTRAPLEYPSRFEAISESLDQNLHESLISTLLGFLKGGKLLISNLYALYPHYIQRESSIIVSKLSLEVCCSFFPVFPPIFMRENPFSLGCSFDILQFYRVFTSFSSKIL